MIKFDCSKCGQTYKVKDELAGRKTKCRKCDVIMTIPGVEPEVEELEAEWIEDEPEEPAQPDNGGGYNEWEDDDAEWEDDAPQLPGRKMPSRKSGVKKKKAKAAPAPKATAEVSMKPLAIGAAVGFLPILVLGLLLVFLAKSATDPIQDRLQTLAMDAIARTKPSLSQDQQQAAAFDELINIRLTLRKYRPYSELVPETVREAIPEKDKERIESNIRIAAETVPAVQIKNMTGDLAQMRAEMPLLVKILVEDIDAGKDVSSIDSKIAYELVQVAIKEARS